MKTTVFALSICFMAILATAAAQSTIIVESFPASNNWWIALTVRNANADTKSISIKNADSSSWIAMTKNDGWGFWTVSATSGAGFTFPLSIRLTSVNGAEVIVNNFDIKQQLNTQLQYGTQADANPDASRRPTTAPTKPVSRATAAPTKPSSKATAAPVATGCSAPMKLLVPLYMSPNSAWDLVAASEASTHTVAIINPNSGPGNGPDNSYKTAMSKLHQAGVELIGYVHTSYGARSLNDVKADIAKYASEFPLVIGIFIDEAAATSDQVSYYTQVHQYIMSFPGYKYNVLNPGTTPVSAYVAISTQIVTYESASSGFANMRQPSFATCNNKDHFAVITYGATSTASMQSVILSAKTKGYYGWVYVTSTSASGNTYGILPSYYSSMATYIKSIA